MLYPIKKLGSGYNQPKNPGIFEIKNMESKNQSQSCLMKALKAGL